MGDLQATIEFCVELHKFINVDLFQRGLYQVRCTLRVSPRLPVQVETNIPENSHAQSTTNAVQNDGNSNSNGTGNGNCIEIANGRKTANANGSVISGVNMNGNGIDGGNGSSGSSVPIDISDTELQKQDMLASRTLLTNSASIINGAGASRVFQILYRNEEILLRDVIQFRTHLLVDSRHLKESIERAEFSLHLELWFGEQNGTSNLSLASTRTLQLNFHPARGLHYHLPVLFDYFHLAAISVGIHASLVALHQPYINAPRSSKPWISSGKLNCRGNLSPGPLEAVFFGPQIAGTTKCSGGPAGRLMQSRQVHRDICSLLLEAVENLKATLNEFSTVVPTNIRNQMGSPPLRQNDVNAKLQQLTDQARVHDSEEDFAIRANSDIAQLCAECVMHWRRVMIASAQSAVHAMLAKRHHILRVRRFAEGFFFMENPRHSAAGCYDSNYQNYVAITEMARRSRYMQTLPPLPVHCTSIDGDTSSLPLIFEDRYIELPNFTRRRTGSDPHLNGHDTTSNMTGGGIIAPKSPQRTTKGDLMEYEKSFLIAGDLNGRAPKKKTASKPECSCGLSYGYMTDSNSFAGVMTPRFALGGNVLQASLTIAPATAVALKGGSSMPCTHSNILARHSVTGLLDEVECAFEHERASFGGTGYNVTLPTRHSKSLDQLDGSAGVQSTPSLRSHMDIEALNYELTTTRQRRHTPSHHHYERSTAANIEESSSGDMTKQQIQSQAEDLMRNIFELRQKYKVQDCEEAIQVPPSSAAIECSGTAIGNRQNETQSHAGKFDYLHEIKLLNPPKQPGTTGTSRTFYNSLPKNVQNGTAPPRNSYPPVGAAKLNADSIMRKPSADLTTTMRVADRRNRNGDHTTNPLMRSNSFQSISQNGGRHHCGAELCESTAIPRSVEIARVRVSDIKEMLRNGAFRKESSSSESDIPSKVSQSKMFTSKSVPFRLETYHNMKKIPKSTTPSANGFSESLPNLAPPSSQPPQPAPPLHIELAAAAAETQKLKEIVVSNSTSSLSEESGWVSSRRSSCGLSSPETITNEDKCHEPRITANMETQLNGEQLRLKLQKLLEQQKKFKKHRQVNTASHNRNTAAATATATTTVTVTPTPTTTVPVPAIRSDGAIHKKVTSITIKLKSDNSMPASRNHVSHEETSTQLKDIERQHQPPSQRRECTKTPNAKSKSDFDLTSLKSVGLFCHGRVPPPKQFQDDLLPPDEFRDPPLPQAKSNQITALEQPNAVPKSLTPKPRPRATKSSWLLFQKNTTIHNVQLSNPSDASTLRRGPTIAAMQPIKPQELPMPMPMPTAVSATAPSAHARKPIEAIDNPVYHIYESLKPISTPAIFNSKPVIRSHSIVEIRPRPRDITHVTQQNGAKMTPTTAICQLRNGGVGANSLGYNEKDDSNKENADFNAKIRQHSRPAQQSHQSQNPTAHQHHPVALQRSDSQRSSNFKSKRKNHEPSISLLEFEKYREEFRKQVKFAGGIYSDYEKLASELPYFCISDEYRVFSSNGLHLIICVHGLDGNAADLRLVRTYLELGLPGANLEFLMSERNQGDTFSDFDTMTDRLVEEILYFIETCGLNPARISFVAHSLGTIIVRSALSRPQMRPLLPRLHTFLSLSGPHLGTLYNTSGLVNMGLWFMQKWKKSGSLLQLCMRDTTDLRSSFLYRLSQRSTLHYFKNILLCGSSQDRYVPAHSARLELCKAAIRDHSNLGTVYREMVHNIIAPILARPELSLTRFDVHHALPHTANTLIGRAAHIAVLDSELFIEKFVLIAGVKYFS